ncbi:glycosyltransferase family 4 protein [Streptomyces sp. CA-251387]|uniref:glycosyltransferase family 4 protein n=1 Tax=Streptomyces sp. CA-251387 TaxID=3240064 RepID=UPI003D9249F2
MTAPTRQSLRVLLVSHYYPPHVGGIENVVRNEAIHLTRLGTEVTVLTSGSRTEARDIRRPRDDVDAAGVRVVRIPAWNGVETRASVPFPILSPRLLPAVLRWARWADVVHAHDCLYMTSWAAGLAAVLTHTPLVLTQHVALVEHPSALVRWTQRVVYAAAGQPLLRRAVRVLVVNASVAAFTLAHGARPQNVHHLANGVDTAAFHPARSSQERRCARERFSLPQNRVLVLFVGRLVPKKGCDLLLAAADPAYDLVFVGEGKEGLLVGQRPGVHRLGALPPDAVAEVYRACDVFALPSTTEGFPLTVQEAMASGLPIVTTDAPGYAPYKLDRAHVTLLPRDVGMLREALASLAGDAKRRERMGRYSRRHAVTSFAWGEHVQTLLRFYSDVLRTAAGDQGDGSQPVECPGAGPVRRP